MNLAKAHVALLASELGCRVTPIRDVLDAMMYVEEKPPRIEIAPVETQRAYVVALHELGHVALGHTQGRPPHEDKRRYFDNGVLKSEAEAWRWAMDNARKVQSRVWVWAYVHGLATYLAGANAAEGQPTRLYNGGRHYVEFVYDKPGTTFYRVKKAMLSGGK